MNFDLSFFIRSRQSSSLVMFFGNYLRAGDEDTFVTLELYNGHLGVRIKFCSVERYVTTNGDGYNDGNQHLVRLQLEGNSILLSVDDTLQLNETVTVDSGCLFNSSFLIFGGTVPGTASVGRRKRETLNTAVTDFSSVVSYKGTIQDVQLNNLSLQFFENSTSSPLETLMSVNVDIVQNEVTDDTCGILTPCENNSTYACENIFFNDYK